MKSNGCGSAPSSTKYMNNIKMAALQICTFSAIKINFFFFFQLNNQMFMDLKQKSKSN